LFVSEEEEDDLGVVGMDKDGNGVQDVSMEDAIPVFRSRDADQVNFWCLGRKKRKDDV